MNENEKTILLELEYNFFLYPSKIVNLKYITKLTVYCRLRNTSVLLRSFLGISCKSDILKIIAVCLYL